MLSVGSIDPYRIEVVAALMPRRPQAVLMIVSGVVTACIWVGPVLAAQLSGTAPARLNGYTTLVAVAIDCAVIAPAANVSGLLIWRRRPLGYLMAIPLPTLLIIAQAISQLSAGVVLTPGEVVGPVSGCAVLALAAVAVLWSVLRRIPH